MTQLTLWDAPTPTRARRPDASEAVLFVLAEVHLWTQRDGAPEAGTKRRTVDAAVARGWLTRSRLGDSDTEGGPRRLHLTPAGREQLLLDREWAASGGFVGVQDHLASRMGVGA